VGSAGGSLDASLVYAAELYDPATMSRLAGDYQSLLESVVADPARPVSQLWPRP
jgi:non-ribosomal peptide synthetase component F